MLKRTITGAVIFVFTLAFVLLKQVSGLFFDAFALIIMMASVYETISAYKKTGTKALEVGLYIVPALLCGLWNLPISAYKIFVLEALVALVLVLLSITVEIIIFAKQRKLGTTEPNAEVLNKSLFNLTKNTMQVFAYPILPLSFLFALNHLGYEIGYIGIVLIFAVSMLTDTMAYFIGRFCGRHKFIPEVSPNKTVEGVVGGFIGGLIGALICYFIFYYSSLFGVLVEAGKAKSIISFLIIGIFGAYANQLGDLIASAMKRKIGIKDYSNLFPGHGGFMDRVDGLMFVTVFSYIILTLFFV